MLHSKALKIIENSIQNLLESKSNHRIRENDILFSNGTGKLGKNHPKCTNQELNPDERGYWVRLLIGALGISFSEFAFVNTE